MRNYYLWLFVTIMLLGAKTLTSADDFKVLWEMDFPASANYVLVSDDGKYFYYCDSGYVKFHDSMTGNLLNKFPDRQFLLLGWQDYYLNNDRIALPYSLDSILVYNIATNETEATIDLGYNIDNPNIRVVSLTSDKRYLSLICFFNEKRHLIIVDLEQKGLFKDIRLYDYITQIFNTNDPNRMIVVTTDQYGYHLREMILDASEEMGYRYNTIEDVDKEGAIRGQKYDANEDAFYYLYLPYDLGKRLSKYEFQNKKITPLYEGLFSNEETIWFNDNNNIILVTDGVLLNLMTGNYLKLRPLDATQYYSSSNDGLKTILIREYTSVLNHKLRRLDVSDFITDVQTVNPNENNLYPNPTTGILNISINNKFPSIFRFDIISDLGQVILTNQIGFLQVNNNNVIINISSIPIGHYLLRISSDRKEFIFNIIKEG